MGDHMRVVVVTGYVEIPGHPRGRAEYDRLASRFADLRAALVLLSRDAIDGCWLYEHVRGPDIRHAVSDNPAKNSIAFHVVQHQKTKWLIDVAEEHPEAEVLVWIDYGIFHQPGVTVDVIDAFLRRVRSDAEIAMPGAWEPWEWEVRSKGAAQWPAEWPDWRFCGSSLVVARELVHPLHDAVRAVTLERLARDRYVTWEVNDWAEVDRRGVLPIRWYRADHDQTQFTNYPGT